MRYKRYPRYKDSDIEWIGEIPEGWETLRFKHVARFFSGTGFPHEEQGETDSDIPFYKVADMNLDGNKRFMKISTNTITYATARCLKATVFPAGSVVFPKVGAALLTNKRRILVQPSCVDNNIMGCVVEKAVVPFLYYWLQNLDMGMLANPGALPSVNENQVKNVYIPLPGDVEQQSIANFLDRKVSQIDSLITDQQKLIELLEEKRSGLITHAVTKGLDPDVPMKDSGIEWIGEIPEGWDTKRLKHCTFINKKSLSEDTEGDYEFTYIDIGSVNSKGVISGLQNVTFGTSPGRARRILSKGDTIVSTVRTYLQSVAYFENPKPNLVCSTGFAVLTPKQEYLVPKYLYYLISSRKLIHEIMRRSVGVSYPAINASELGNLHCLIPDKYIQEEIVDYLDSKIVDIGHLVSDIQRSIELLEEYKQSLITAAVTGKIDVREGGVHSA